MAGKKKRKDKLAMGLAIVSKAFKDDDSFVQLDASKKKVSHPHLPTGSIICDWAIGGKENKYGVPACPGFPKGRIVNVYGHESSGKTTLVLENAARTIANGGQVCFIDWENAIDLTYASALGIPPRPDQVHAGSA